MQLIVQLIKKERKAYYLHYNGKFPNKNSKEGAELITTPLQRNSVLKGPLFDYSKSRNT